MKCNFDEIINRRGTNSFKWDKTKEFFGRNDILPMWVADSDWPTAAPIIKALKERVEHGAIGYTFPGEELNEIIIEWIKNYYNWEIKKEWIVYTCGVVPSINLIIRGFSLPGDEVILQSPVYYPFFQAIRNNGGQIANNQLKWDGRRYVMDYDDLESIIHRKTNKLRGPSRARLMILCSPHNPVGRVWEKEELKKLGQICIENDIMVISDEIHADFTFYNNKHNVFASLSEEFANNSITLFAPSKTFNIAGLEGSIAIIPDEKIRNKFNNVCTGIMGSGNALSLVAMKAAYKCGEEWLKAQLNYLENNINYACDFINNEIKNVQTYKPEGTYLLWMNFKETGFKPEQLNDFMINKARVALDAGSWFGSGGENYMRLNLACPRSLLIKGLNRINKALEDELSGKSV